MKIIVNILVSILLWSQYTSPAATGANGTTASTLPSPVGKWLVNEGGAATTALDSSGNGNNATWVGTQSCSGSYYTTGYVLPNAGCLDGSTNYMTIPNGTALQFTGSGTMTAWINLASLPSSGGFWVVMQKGQSGNWGFIIFVTNNGTNTLVTTHVVTTSPSTADNFATCSTALSTSTWYFVAAAFDNVGKTVTCYTNTTASSPTSTGNTQRFGGGSVLGGFFSPLSDAFHGDLEDMRMYDSVLTAPQLSLIYTTGPS